MANHPPRTSAQNTPDIVRLVTSDMVTEMRIGAEALGHIEALFAAIDDCTSRDNRTAMLRLAQIRTLARLGKYVAADRSNLIDIVCDEFKSERLPLLLAAVQGGAR